MTISKPVSLDNPLSPPHPIAILEDDIDFLIAVAPVGDRHAGRGCVVQIRAYGGFDQPPPQLAIAAGGGEVLPT